MLSLGVFVRVGLVGLVGLVGFARGASRTLSRSTHAEEVLEDEKFESFVIAGGDEGLLRGAVERPHFLDEMLENFAAAGQVRIAFTSSPMNSPALPQPFSSSTPSSA